MKVEYIKKLGTGVSGSAYLVKNKNKYRFEWKSD